MTWEKELDAWVAGSLPDLNYMTDEPMARHTSFRTGGPAKRFACPASCEELTALLEFAAAHGARPLVIGNGTNLLAPDEGLDRLVIDTSTGMKQILTSDNTLQADAGVTLTKLAETACRMGLEGLVFAHGIPGTVGGAVCMNAGAYGGDMSQVLTSVTAWFPGEGVREMSLEELRLGYRHSLFTERPDAVVLRATVTLKAGGDPEAIRQGQRELMEKRKASQPLEYPSAGSTFKRPEGYFAGALIQQCGLKGLTIGGAQVSEKHAGFVINRGGATSADVLAVIAEVQRRVLEETGVQLEPEVRILH